MGTYKSWRIVSEDYLNQDELNQIVVQIKSGCINGQVYSENFLPKSTELLKTVLNDEHEDDYSNYMQECRDLIKRGSILVAVKVYRDATQMGLRNSKLAIDALIEEMTTSGELPVIQPTRRRG